MAHRPEDDWEELARREPHYAVLTDERFLSERLTTAELTRFFASGEADVATLFAQVERYAGRPFHPRTALDFGCGVGRLTLPLARRAGHILGVDAAPTMLAMASRYGDAAALTNLDFGGSLDDARDGTFDFVCSLIVFQHIPVWRGETLLRQLLGKLRPHGFAALHFALDRPGGVMRQTARRLRGSLPLLHAAIQAWNRDRRRLPYMQMNTYDRRRLIRIVEELGCREPELIPLDQGEIGGAILLTEKL